MSMLIRGTVKGVKTVNKNSRDGNAYSVTYIGFETPKVNGYQGETQTTDVQITKEQLSKGVPAYYEKLVGQEVLAPIFIMLWKTGGGYTLFFEGDGTARPLDKKAA